VKRYYVHRPENLQVSFFPKTCSVEVDQRRSGVGMMHPAGIVFVYEDKRQMGSLQETVLRQICYSRSTYKPNETESIMGPLVNKEFTTVTIINTDRNRFRIRLILFFYSNHGSKLSNLTWM
jgi:hypothetical protein